MIQVDRGDTTSMQSSVQTTYAPCACSPLGKVQQTSQPFVFGSAAARWTTYTYDGLGRPVTVVQPDGDSTTIYAYSGNVTTVSDPKGNSKQFTSDVEGNLISVSEPDPCVTTNNLITTYTYDWMKHVTGVAMSRSNTSYPGTPPCTESGTPVTQNRSFVYDSAGRLTSATNPENGTTSYVYNTDNTLHYKTDAKSQQTVYAYDSLKRLTMTQYYPLGMANPEDGCQRVTYSYDTNPYKPELLAKQCWQANGGAVRVVGGVLLCSRRLLRAGADHRDGDVFRGNVFVPSSGRSDGEATGDGARLRREPDSCEPCPVRTCRKSRWITHMTTRAERRRQRIR